MLIKWGSPSSSLRFKHSELKLKVFLTGCTVAMVNWYIKRMTIICLPMTGHLSDIIIAGLYDKES